MQWVVTQVDIRQIPTSLYYLFFLVYWWLVMQTCPRKTLSAFVHFWNLPAIIPPFSCTYYHLPSFSSVNAACLSQDSNLDLWICCSSLITNLPGRASVGCCWCHSYTDTKVNHSRARVTCCWVYLSIRGLK